MVQYCLSRSNRRRAIDFTLKKMTVETAWTLVENLPGKVCTLGEKLPREACAEVSLLVQLYYCSLG
jgi:hypothetical protein